MVVSVLSVYLFFLKALRSVVARSIEHSQPLLVLEVVELDECPEGHQPLLQFHLVRGLEVKPPLPHGNPRKRATR